ncbi:unnamed protein product [Closterium sp. Yama58-4]|nr:unnamed protein product [Closterium sp. Yama58-4]
MWNAHTSFGNILGSLLAAASLASGWGWAFLVPGIAIIVAAFVVLLFLPPGPEELAFEPPEEEEEKEKVVEMAMVSGGVVGIGGERVSVGPGGVLYSPVSTRDGAGVGSGASEVGSGAPSGAGGAGGKLAGDAFVGERTAGGDGERRSSQLAEKRDSAGAREGNPAGETGLPALSNHVLTQQNGTCINEDGGARSPPPKLRLPPNQHQQQHQQQQKDVSTYDDDSAGLLEELETAAASIAHMRSRASGSSSGGEGVDRAVGFLEAWRIPGVAAFALCLFFAKLVAYTFLYWLPFFISRTEIEGRYLSDAQSGIMSTVFDVGGVVGGILAGHLADQTAARATVSASFLLLAAPALAAYFLLGGIALWVNILLLSLSGVLVNGPYALITCAVSADLGQHKSLQGNARALATRDGGGATRVGNRAAKFGASSFGKKTTPIRRRRLRQTVAVSLTVPRSLKPNTVKPIAAELISAEPITVDVFPAVFLERDYEFMGEIGSGQYGKVWKCRSRLTGRQFACKQVKKRPARPARSGKGQKARKDSAQRRTREKIGGVSGADDAAGSGDDVDPIEREIAALTHLEGCEGVTSLHGVFEDATSVFLVMDLCDSGDLFSLIADTDGVPEDESRQLFADVARAVKECHDRGVLHRDIKPDNVLLSLRETTTTAGNPEIAGLDYNYPSPASNTSWTSAAPLFHGFRATTANEPLATSRRYDVKLADFGLSVILTGGARVRGYAGSFPYEAPEVVGLREYSFAADIWSMGVLLYALLSANWPEFKNRQVLNEETDWTGASWDQVSEDAKDLIRRLLTVDQDRRPTIDEGTKLKQNSSLLPPLLIPSQSLDSRDSASLESASSIPSEASFLSALAATPASLPTPTATFACRGAMYPANERSHTIGAVTGGSAGIRSNCASRGSSSGSETLPVSDNSGACDVPEASCDCIEGCGLKARNPKCNPKRTHQRLRKRGSAGNAGGGDETRGQIATEEERRCFSEPSGGSHGRREEKDATSSGSVRRGSATGGSATGASASEPRNKDNYGRAGSPLARRGSIKEYAAQVVSNLRWQPACFYSTAEAVVPEAPCDDTAASSAATTAATSVTSAAVPPATDFGGSISGAAETQSQATEGKETARIWIFYGQWRHIYPRSL